ncbi:hypothetical protein [Kordiimonas sp. SCSIO 12610]|uniref:hypothetical protein n=1 Tax=Kordiimonas sp. SCSIO 12610 TaxID=2829597 RepID=UPI00210E776B|nr:hypothetical protein [Kordiimonas sp. SCSIO 12610]UTW53819.1 hypothetical protein KFF44_08155 [Kordiimonas sp. SCSIO 12610]
MKPLGITILLLVIAAFLGSQALYAQQSPPPNPCEADENFRAFDFWLGKWNVSVKSTGQNAGVNTITVIEDGCALLEQWQSANGTTGQSINYYNPNTEKWRQVWVARGYSIDMVGGMKDGSMELVGTISYYGNKTDAQIKGIWTPNDDGTVRQHFLQYNKETETWDDWFDGTYKRVAED